MITYSSVIKLEYILLHSLRTGLSILNLLYTVFSYYFRGLCISIATFIITDCGATLAMFEHFKLATVLVLLLY